MPISSASTNVRIVTPPNSSSTTSVSITVSDVFNERVSVCARLWLTTSSNGLARAADEVLADAVEHDDRVVDREADDRQHGHDEHRLELDLAGKMRPRIEKMPEHDQRVVDQRDDGGGAVAHRDG